MPESESPKEPVNEERHGTDSSPLIFISHDSRDAELAEAFSKLLKSVSSGMLKSFRSTDHTGKEGIDYGDPWYTRLMEKLEKASDVVCLFTARSLDRPWILFEAGVAKGKLDTPVHGISLGIPLQKVSNSGPFYQFQNCQDDEDSLTGLVLQLTKRIPEMEPDPDMVKTAIQVFMSTEKKILASLDDPDSGSELMPINDSSAAKLFEEIKVMFRDLPSRLDDRLIDVVGPTKRKPFRKFHPMMEEIMHLSSPNSPDPALGFLIILSYIRDDLPWLYEIGMDVYRAVHSASKMKTKEAYKRFRNAIELTMRGPFAEEFMMRSKDSHMVIRELYRLFERQIEFFMESVSITENGKD